MCPMCRATVGELYVPPEPTAIAEEAIEASETSVQIEDAGAQQCRNRGTQISCVACLLAFVVLLIVIVRIIMEN